MFRNPFTPGELKKRISKFLCMFINSSSDRIVIVKFANINDFSGSLASKPALNSSTGINKKKSLLLCFKGNNPEEAKNVLVSKYDSYDMLIMKFYLVSIYIHIHYTYQHNM